MAVINAIAEEIMKNIYFQNDNKLFLIQEKFSDKSKIQCYKFSGCVNLQSQLCQFEKGKANFAKTAGQMEILIKWLIHKLIKKLMSAMLFQVPVS